MSESPLAPELSAGCDNPLGSVELTSKVTFGVREAALAGVAVPRATAIGHGGVFADVSTLVWTMHPTCSGTLTFTDESYMDRAAPDDE